MDQNETKSIIPSHTFLSAAKIKRDYQLSSSAIKRWAHEGKIAFVQTPGGKHLYSIQDLERLIGVPHNKPSRQRVAYARVSSSHQKEDLERQVQFLQKEYPHHQIIQDIGSGLNWKRKGLQRILERIHEGTVQELVVTYRDRLCRFGFELFDWVCKKHDCAVLVHHQTDSPQDATTELAEDLLAVSNFFVAKTNGMRAARNRKNRRDQENQAALNPCTKEKDQRDDGSLEVALQPST